MTFTVSTVEPGKIPAELKLTNRQKAALSALAWWGPNWVRPLDIGGRNKSYHSATLAQLETKGLVESKQRSGYRYRRGSKVYRLTDAGQPVAQACDYERDSILLDRLGELAAKA